MFTHVTSDCKKELFILFNGHGWQFKDHNQEKPMSHYKSLGHAVLDWDVVFLLISLTNFRMDK